MITVSDWPIVMSGAWLKFCPPLMNGSSFSCIA